VRNVLRAFGVAVTLLAAFPSYAALCPEDHYRFDGSQNCNNAAGTHQTINQVTNYLEQCKTTAMSNCQAQQAGQTGTACVFSSSNGPQGYQVNITYNGNFLTTFSKGRYLFDHVHQDAIQCPECSLPDQTVVKLDMEGSSPSSICSQNCNMTRTEPGLLVGVIDSGVTKYYGIEYTSDGSYCQTPTPGVSPGSASTSIPAPDGSTVTVNQDDPQCYTFHGEKICSSETATSEGGTPIPTQGCVTTAGGQSICTNENTSPDAPDNGTPGTPATPDFVATIGDGSGSGQSTVNNYNSTTVNGSTHQPGQGGDGDGDGDGDPEPDPEDDCLNDGNCGPLPELPGEGDGLEAYDTLKDGVQDAITNHPASGWTPTVPGIEVSGCQTMTITFFNPFGSDINKTFPTPELCDFIENTYKPVADFFLSIFVLFYAWMRVARSNGGA